jgi:hypothetical protein
MDWYIQILRVEGKDQPCMMHPTETLTSNFLVYTSNVHGITLFASNGIACPDGTLGVGLLAYMVHGSCRKQIFG